MASIVFTREQLTKREFEALIHHISLKLDYNQVAKITKVTVEYEPVDWIKIYEDRLHNIQLRLDALKSGKQIKDIEGLTTEGLKELLNR